MTERLYSWNLTIPAQRAAWLPQGSTRKTYGVVTDEVGREMLGCTVEAVGGTAWSTVNQTFAVWQGPILDVAEGDVITIVAQMRWRQADGTLGNTLVPPVSDPPGFGNPVYSPAANKNGFAVPVYTSLHVDGNFVQNVNPEPSTRKFAGHLCSTSWHGVPGYALADSAGTLSPTLNVGALWANVGGVIFVQGVSISIKSRNQ